MDRSPAANYSSAFAAARALLKLDGHLWTGQLEAALSGTPLVGSTSIVNGVPQTHTADQQIQRAKKGR